MFRLFAAASMLLGSLSLSIVSGRPAQAQRSAPYFAHNIAQNIAQDGAPDAPTKLAPDNRQQATPQDHLAGEKTQDVLTIVVAGDSIADGIWGGLYRMLQRDKRYNIVREAKNSSGFTAFDWLAEMQAILKLHRADAIVFLVGANDRQTLIMRDKPRTLFRTKEWEENYAERVSTFMQFVKAQNIPLLWVGLPIARKAEFNKDSQYLNDIYSAAAIKNDIVFVNIWAMFANKDGEYSAYLPDAGGKNQLLRHNDGIHFTPAGYELIAEAVLANLRRKVPAFAQAALPPGDAKPADLKPSDAKPADAKPSDGPQSKTVPQNGASNPPMSAPLPAAAPPAATPGSQQSATGEDAKRVEELKKNDEPQSSGAPEMNAVREPRPKTVRKR